MSPPSQPVEGARLRILIACMQFPTGPGQSYMTTELAAALTSAGCRVEVLVLEWGAPDGDEVTVELTAAGVRVVRCRPRAFSGFGRMVQAASKFVLSGRRVARVARERFELSSFDLAIMWAPAVAMAPLVGLLRRAGVARRLLFIWDVFPDHHREIGLAPPGPPYWIARAWEQSLLRRFTTVICTLPGNVDYLRRRWRVDPSQRLVSTPIWSDTTPLPAVDRDAVRRRHGLPAEGPIAVFGGQIVEGRGFGQMLAAAQAGAAAGSPLLYLFVGDGRLTPMLRERALAQANVEWRPAMPRDAYLELLGACDVGMAATVEGVTSFSIPTKTIDYLRAGLGVVAAVEHGSDYVGILDRYGVGAAVAFGDADGFHRQAERLATDPQVRAAMVEAAPRCLDEVFDVRHAVRTVLEAAA